MAMGPFRPILAANCLNLVARLNERGRQLTRPYHKRARLCLRRRRREIASLTPKPTVNPIIKLPRITSSAPNMHGA
jgi:hypothetical protein